MCEKCEMEGEYRVTLTLTPRRREALGKAIGLVKRMATENRGAGWVDLYNHLVPLANEMRKQLWDLETALGKNPPPFVPDREV